MFSNWFGKDKPQAPAPGPAPASRAARVAPPPPNPLAALNVDSLYKQGMVHYNAKNYPKALEYFQEIVRKEPNLGWAYGSVGWTYYLMKDYRRSLESFKSSVRLEKTNALSFQGIGWSAYMLKDYAKAIEAFDESFRHKNDCFASCSGKGWSYYFLEDYARAVQSFNVALRINDKYTNSLAGRGYAYYKLGNYEQAMNDFKSNADIDPKDKYAPNGMALVHAVHEDYARAIADVNESIRLEPNDYYASYTTRGHISYLMGDYRNAIPDLLRSIQIEPSPHSPTTHLYLAQVYIKLGDFASAMMYIEQARALKPDYAFSYTVRGEYFIAMAVTEGDNIEGKREYYVKAETDFRTALRIALMGAKERLDSEAGLREAVRLLAQLPPPGSVPPPPATAAAASSRGSGTASASTSSSSSSSSSPAMTHSSSTSSSAGLSPFSEEEERSDQRAKKNEQRFETAKSAVKVVGMVVERLPVVGAAGSLLLLLVDLCDGYKCNMDSFMSLKSRMNNIHRLYFSQGGIADVAINSGKGNVVEPFASQLEDILKDAIEYLKAFTKKGFLSKLFSGNNAQKKFDEIDRDVTACLDDLAVALQLVQIAGQAQTYNAVCNIQQQVDRAGGLHGLQAMSAEELRKFGEDIGIRDIGELQEEISDCLQRIEGAVGKVGEDVNSVKRLVEGQDVQFMELKEMMLQLAQIVQKQSGPGSGSGSGSVSSSTDSATPSISSHISSKSGAAGSVSSSSVDIARWAMREMPVINKKDILGSGSFGVVYGGSYMDRDAAFKMLNIVASNSSDLLKEVKLHLKVSACPGVVQILAVDLQANAFTSEPCIVMERAAGSLHDYIHPRTNHNLALPPINLSLPGKLTMMAQIASCLEYISSAGLVHRDIKSSNVLLFIDKETGDVVAKICDFGLSKSVGGSVDMSSRVSVKGTPTYLAPEAFDMEYSSASDVYAYGILLNETLTEQFPIPVTLGATGAPSIPQLVKAVCTNGLRPALYDEPGVVGDALRQLVSRCWHQDVVHRCAFPVVTVELRNILQAALDVTRFGSRGVDVSKLMQSLHISPSVSSSSAAAATTTTTIAAAAAAATTTTTTSGTSSATTLSSSSSTVDATSSVSSSSSTTKSLSELTVDEVAALMSSLGLHQLKETFVTKNVNGLMLSYCEEVDDLKSAEYGVTNNAMARGLLKSITEWREKGVTL